MQICGLHKNIYRAASYALSIEINDTLAEQRRKILGDWELLNEKGLCEKEISKVIGMSRSTYYGAPHVKEQKAVNFTERFATTSY